MRSLIGLVGLAGGAGLLVFGLQSDDGTVYLLAGAAALVVGLIASFRYIRCPSCSSRMWVSSKKLTHCMQCGNDWTQSTAAP